MKIARVSYLFNLVLLALFGWGMFELLNASQQLAGIAESPEPPWVMKMNLMPMIALLALGFIVPFVFSKLLPKGKRSLKHLLIPGELFSADEREEQVIRIACKNVYIAMWLTVSIVAAVMTAYPLMISVFPQLPVLLVLLIPLVLITTFQVTVEKKMK
ncbi:hypothetical protein JSY36_16180 [Bacillus sp. H-16]|uniref:hypothetical protein n=1 Tax=Alteribacter salitolerans TaxID=2912333 RepID=UPI001965B92B|nr:hypothetical protein [Alteribacter salitolerans]MBM7097271.1 hypothetical protein [Alteribacter salitolerans]